MELDGNKMMMLGIIVDEAQAQAEQEVGSVMLDVLKDLAKQIKEDPDQATIKLTVDLSLTRITPENYEIETESRWQRSHKRKHVAEKVDLNLNQDELFAREEMRGRSGSDDLKQQAIEICKATGRTSIAMIQRRLKIGFTRAARIMDDLEDDGLVSAPEADGGRQWLGD